MGMKFHKFYVAAWNTPGILVSAILAILPLLVALNSGPVIRRSGIPYISGLETGTVPWALFGLAAAIFLFLLITEFLPVARRQSGIIMLSISLILGIVSNIASYMRYTSRTPWCSMAVSVVVSALIPAYYRKRYKSFS